MLPFYSNTGDEELDWLFFLWDSMDCKKHYGMGWFDLMGREV